MWNRAQEDTERLRSHWINKNKHQAYKPLFSIWKNTWLRQDCVQQHGSKNRHSKNSSQLLLSKHFPFIDTRQLQTREKITATAVGRAFFCQTPKVLHEKLVINASFPNLATLTNQSTGHSSRRNWGSSVLLLTKWLLCKGNGVGHTTSPKCCHWRLLLKMAVFHCISFITQEKSLTSIEVTVPGIWISFALAHTED